MKKIMFLSLGFIFFISVQAIPCSISLACPDGTSLSCEGNYSCSATPDGVFCTNTNGTYSFGDC